MLVGVMYSMLCVQPLMLSHACNYACECLHTLHPQLTQGCLQHPLQHVYSNTAPEHLHMEISHTGFTSVLSQKSTSLRRSVGGLHLTLTPKIPSDTLRWLAQRQCSCPVCHCWWLACASSSYRLQC